MNTVNKVATPVGNLGNIWEFDLCHSQPVIGWEFVKFVQSLWESTQNNVSFRKRTSKTSQIF